MGERAEYAKLLIKFAHNKDNVDSSVPFSGTNYKSMERRILGIMKKTGKRKNVVSVFIMVILLSSVPITTYASAKSTILVTDKIISIYERNNVTETNMDIMFDETEEVTKGLFNPRYIGKIYERAGNPVDCEIGAKETIAFFSKNLNTGQKIHITVLSDRSTDRFEAGIINSNGKKTYVSSKNGSVNKEFSITSDGEYTVYFKGKNTDGENIHLTGKIRVE